VTEEENKIWASKFSELSVILGENGVNYPCKKSIVNRFSKRKKKKVMRNITYTETKGHTSWL
jgi:hypothetical protein